MKRILGIILVVLMACTLCACKSEEAQAVDDMIAAIGEVTADADCDLKITEAEAAVAALDEQSAKQLENLAILKEARKTFDVLSVESVIAKIGAVDLSDTSLVAEAREAYDQADEEVRGLVSNYAALEAAENELSNLQVENVETLIAAIGKVSATSEGAINEAKDAYEELSSAQKGQVTNTKVLNEAESALKDLKQKAAAEAIAKLNSRTDKVTGITWYEHDNQPEYIDTRCYAIPYIGKQGNDVWLRMMINYTGDEWVFWEKLTIVADGKNYTKYYSYYDVIRDNQNGYVWEYIDFSPTEDDIKMLKAIAASSETIIRFEGDERYYDLTVRSADKTAIREVLAAYEAMKG